LRGNAIVTDGGPISMQVIDRKGVWKEDSIGRKVKKENIEYT
jgi:hypothetical protein